MKILIIGKGGREHAIARALALEPSPQHEVFVSPGNPGMHDVAKQVSLSNIDQAVSWAKATSVDLVVIGPETELMLGWSDAFRKAGISCFGPGQVAAQLEASKIFSKLFMQEFKIPTARFFQVSSVDETLEAAKNFKPPFVLKADGLCAGKGVLICQDISELNAAAEKLFVEKIFAKNGERAILEEFTHGKEISLFVLCNKTDYKILPVYRDHKRLLDQDRGPNTGGMGVVGPISLDKKLIEQIKTNIVQPSVQGLNKKGFDYRGVLFIGIMLTENGPSVLEYNVRFGDPEAQCLLPQLDGSWSQSFLEVANDKKISELRWKRQHIACVVLASAGYPDHPKTGDIIKYEAGPANKSHYILWAGVENSKDKKSLITKGGRVANAIGIGDDLPAALKNAYQQATKITWPGIQYRKDIGN